MSKEDISAVCLSCRLALASLGTVVDETKNDTWKSWLKEASPEDAALLLNMMSLLTMSKKMSDGGECSQTEKYSTSHREYGSAS